MVYTPAWERRKPDGNPYAHPIHGCYAVIDLDTLELLEIETHEGGQTSWWWLLAAQ